MCKECTNNSYPQYETREFSQETFVREQLDERIYNFFVTEEYIDDCGLFNQSYAWKGVGLMKEEWRRGVT